MGGGSGGISFSNFECPKWPISTKMTTKYGIYFIFFANKRGYPPPLVLRGRGGGVRTLPPGGNPAALKLHWPQSLAAIPASRRRHYNPANKRCYSSVVLMLGERRNRWPTFNQRVVFSINHHLTPDVATMLA